VWTTRRVELCAQTADQACPVNVFVRVVGHRVRAEGPLTDRGCPVRPGLTSGIDRDDVEHGAVLVDRHEPLTTVPTDLDFEPGDTLAVDNATFTLQQMHFHAPSENQIAGHSFPMEAHFVHADAQGNVLVVAVMFKEGEALTALNQVWAAMPSDAGPPRPLLNVVTPMAFLPKSRSYYRFSGSLTTPPCTEGVRWVVLETPVSASKSQIEAFEHAIKHHNNRPVQPLNGRVVIEKK